MITHLFKYAYKYETKTGLKYKYKRKENNYLVYCFRSRQYNNTNENIKLMRTGNPYSPY